MKSLERRVLALLNQMVEQETSMSAPDFPASLELGGADVVEWVASTWTGFQLANIFMYHDGVAAPGFVISFHSDGGATVAMDGPFRSREEAEASVDTDEGWSSV